jgi:xanthosine utilization system XapX-like protein
VYAGFATFVVAAIVRLAIPAYPTLAQAMVVRGAMGMLIGWVITGLAYVRAAGNELSATRR